MKRPQSAWPMKTRGATRRSRRFCTRFKKRRRTANNCGPAPGQSTSAIGRSGSGLLRGVGCSRGGSGSPGIFSKANHVGEDAVRAGHAFRHLAVERVRVVDVHALAILRIDQSALLRLLAGIVRFEKRFIT